jgi:hypothetical protein
MFNCTDISANKRSSADIAPSDLGVTASRRAAQIRLERVLEQFDLVRVFCAQNVRAECARPGKNARRSASRLRKNSSHVLVV